MKYAACHTNIDIHILEWKSTTQREEPKKIRVFYYHDKHVFHGIEDNKTKEDLNKYADYIMKIQNHIDENGTIDDYEFEVEI